MAITKQQRVEPIPGYRLISQLGKGGCGEVWKCEAPGGLFKAVKFVHGDLRSIDDDGQGAVSEELQAIENIKAIRHPFLLSMERVECIDGELVIVTELADRNLHQLLEEYQAGGHAGVPRSQVLDFLRETAEVLDLINWQHGLQHLDVKPRNLFLVYNHVKVGDFGLVHSLSAGGASTESNMQLGAITPLYASPEVFRGAVSPYSDQYSLAVSYQELLTGTLPFNGENSRQLLMQHTEEEPNLDPLPENDRAVIARALAKDPEQRFPSCMAMIEALMHAEVEPPSETETTEHAAEPPPETATTLPALARPEADTDRGLGNTSRRNQSLAETKRRKLGFVGPYRLVEQVNQTPLAEHWYVVSPDGQRRILKYLFGFTMRNKELDQIIHRLKAIHHPVLNEFEVEEKGAGRIGIVSNVEQNTLRDEFRECRQRKLKGIPRAEVIDMLSIVAEGLDYLYRQHSLQHLNLHPRNILVNADGRVMLDEFGLFHLLWTTSMASLQQCNARYAAPELLEGRVSAQCDQYSLAVIYTEMTTGMFPKSHRDPLPVRVEELPTAEQAAVRRALDPNPANRYGTCSEFIKALDGEDGDSSQFADYAAEQFNSVIQASPDGKPTIDKTVAVESAAALKELVQTIINGATGESLDDTDQAPQLSDDGQSLHCHFTAGLPLGDARLKLEAVRSRLFGHLVEDNADRFVFHINMSRKFWQQWMGLQPGLRISVSMQRQHPMAPTPIVVNIEIAGMQINPKQVSELLEDAGVDLMEQLQSELIIGSNKRIHDRLDWSQDIDVCPVEEDGTVGEPIRCRCKDLSLNGLGFYLPHQLDTSEVLVVINDVEDYDTISIPARLVRAKPCADGGYEVGALFRVTAWRKTMSEIMLPS